MYVLKLSFLSFFAVGSRDTSCRVYSVHRLPGYRHVTLAAHRSPLVACFFQRDSLNVSKSHNIEYAVLLYTMY